MSSCRIIGLSYVELKTMNSINTRYQILHVRDIVLSTTAAIGIARHISEWVRLRIVLMVLVVVGMWQTYNDT